MRPSIRDKMHAILRPKPTEPPRPLDDMDSLEVQEAEGLFQAQPLKPILKGEGSQEKGGKREGEGRSKSVSFYEEGRPIYIMGDERRWKDEIRNEKKGKFDLNEQRVLCDAVGQFLVTNEIEFEQFRQMISSGEHGVLKREKFFKLLSNVLPNRSPASCYKFILREYSALNHKGAWSQEEVDSLLALVSKYGRRWKLIGKELNRTKDNVYDKYRSLGEEGFEDRVSNMWKVQQLIVLLREIESQSKEHFLDPQVKEVLLRQAEHDEEERKELEKHKYNSKHFVFHNIAALGPYLNTKVMKTVLPEKVRWKKVQRALQNKTVFDCRNKFVQLLQVNFRNSATLDHLLILFLQAQSVRRETDIRWKNWRSREFTAEEARNRLMILKKLVEGRSSKQFSMVLEGIKAKVRRKELL